MSNVDPIRRLPTGRIARYSFVGTYPLAFTTDRGETLCADCAQEELDDETSEHRPTGSGVVWEADPKYWPICDLCSKHLEVAIPPEGFTATGERT